MHTGAKNDFYTKDTQHQRRRLSADFVCIICIIKNTKKQNVRVGIV
jgi:hypothetical protein